MELYLIAALGYDLGGSRGLRAILEHLKSDHIVVDYDNLSVKRAVLFEKLLDQEEGRKYLFDAFMDSFPDSNKDTLQKFLSSVGYSYIVPKNYCIDMEVEKDVEIYNLNPANVQRKDFSEDMKSVEKYLSMTLEDLSLEISRWYSKDIEVNPESISELTEHDSEVARNIRTLSETVVFIGNLPQIFGPYPNVFENLKDLNPKRLKLNKVYEFIENDKALSSIH